MTESSHILSFLYQSPTDDEPLRSITKVDHAKGKDSISGLSSAGALLDLSDSERMSACIRHSFPPDPLKKAMKLEVNGRKGRRVVCVLYDDLTSYAVYDIDSSARQEPEEDDGADDGDVGDEGDEQETWDEEDIIMSED